jgi:IPT/TIG domain
MTLFKQHMGRRVAAVGAAVGLLVLGLAAPAYAAVPTITAMLPASPSPGCEATLTGTNFQVAANGGPVDVATFQQGGNPPVTDNVAAGDIDADTQLQVDVPNTLAASTATTVFLHNTGTGSGNSATFSFTTGPAGTCPAVPTFTPNSGAAGTSVTITPQGGGNGFVTPPTAVRFNTTLATSVTSSTAASVTALVPCGATTGEIHVYTVAGQRTSTGNFTVTSGGVGAPTITSFAPTSGPVGTSVVITGTNFSGTGITGTAVTFNNVAATSIVVNSATQITATVPSTATTGKIKVTTSCGSITSATDFTVTKVHSRSVTLSLKKHIVAKGAVSVSDAFTACAASVPVKIQRRVNGNWKNVGSTTTDASGAYSKKIKDKEGKYRAKAPKVTLNSGVDICSGAKSSVRKHTH